GGRDRAIDERIVRRASIRRPVLARGGHSSRTPLLLESTRAGIGGIPEKHRVEPVLEQSLTEYVHLQLVELHLRANAPKLLLNEHPVRRAGPARDWESE